MKKFFLTLALLCIVAVSQAAEHYIVTFEIKQSTFTLDVFEHIKNKINAIEFTIATDKQTYDVLHVGQEVSKSFKFGSLFFNGDFSNLKITVKRKTIQNY